MEEPEIRHTNPCHSVDSRGILIRRPALHSASKWFHYRMRPKAHCHRIRNDGTCIAPLFSCQLELLAEAIDVLGVLGFAASLSHILGALFVAFFAIRHGKLFRADFLLDALPA